MWVRSCRSCRASRYKSMWLRYRANWNRILYQPSHESSSHTLRASGNRQEIKKLLRFCAGRPRLTLMDPCVPHRKEIFNATERVQSTKFFFTHNLNSTFGNNFTLQPFPETNPIPNPCCLVRCIYRGCIRTLGRSTSTSVSSRR